MLGEWFLGDPESIELKRIETNLGLRGSVRYYNDLVVPGVGNTWFVRQFTLACIAIEHAPQKINKIVFGNAIEALGMKSHFLQLDGRNYQYRGIRAFGNAENKKNLTYHLLKKQESYVQITYRQNTSRSLPLETGLGFVDEGNGFSSFSLSALGHALLQEHQSQYTLRVKDRLEKWVQGSMNIDVKPANQLFGPISTPVERAVVLQALLSDCYYNFPGLRGDTKRRIDLIDAFKGVTEEPTIQSVRKIAKNKRMDSFLEDFNKAVEFFDLLQSGQKLLVTIYGLLESGQKIKQNHESLSKPVQDLIKKAETFLIKSNSMQLEAEAEKLANFIVSNSKYQSNIVQEIAFRDGRVCVPIEGHLIQGMLYDKDAIAENKFVKSVPKTITNIYKLWKECK